MWCLETKIWVLITLFIAIDNRSWELGIPVHQALLVRQEMYVYVSVHSPVTVCVKPWVRISKAGLIPLVWELVWHQRIYFSFPPFHICTSFTNSEKSSSCHLSMFTHLICPHPVHFLSLPSPSSPGQLCVTSRSHASPAPPYRSPTFPHLTALDVITFEEGERRKGGIAELCFLKIVAK